jgi:hypothetical protein
VQKIAKLVPPSAAMEEALAENIQCVELHALDQRKSQLAIDNEINKFE